MISLVFGFYFVPATFRVFDLLAQWKEQWGYAYSAISAIIAGAVIPEALRILLFQRGRITRRNAGNFLFAASFWGISGMEVDLFYRLQATWFGSEATFGVISFSIVPSSPVRRQRFSMTGSRLDSRSPAFVDSSLWTSIAVPSYRPCLPPGGSGFRWSRRFILYRPIYKSPCSRWPFPSG